MEQSLDSGSNPIFHGTFFEDFLAITHYQTMVAILLLIGSFILIYQLQKRGSSFFVRMSVGLVIGALLGLGVQGFEGFPEGSTVILHEASTWYGLVGRTFISFIRMLVIPLIFVSIVKVIIDFADDRYLSKVAMRGISWLLITTGIAVILGMILANLLGIGVGEEAIVTESVQREYSTLVDTFVNLVPNNIVTAMNSNNIIGLVIFSALLGLASNHIEKDHPESIAVFKKWIDALHKIVMSITRLIITFMPYAIIALLAGTIISNGIPAIIKVSNFVIAIYIATVVMLIIHIILIMIHGLSPITFIKKSLDTWVMAFSSRSSMGTLPMTISTLTQRMGVTEGTANLIPSLGTTMGMNGCAGFFPALVVMMVAQMVGIEMNIQFYIMLFIIVVIGSIGIAGIPGTATIAATIALSGMGMGEYFPLIGMVLAIDPIIDMARTLANVSGAMTAAVVTDRELGLLDQNRYADLNAGLDAE